MSPSPARSRSSRSAAIAAHPGLNIVINNAGVALLGQFAEIDQAQMDWLMNINFWGVVHATRAFLPHLSRQREAHIVNLSSIFGIIAPPGQTAYAAAKFAVRGFSESLRHELQMAKSPVKLSVVHPGGVATNIVRNSRTGAGVTDNARRAQSIERFDAVAKTTPAAAALRIITGIEKNQPRILIGNDARFMDLLQRLRPGDLLGGAGAADREDGGAEGEVRHDASVVPAIVANAGSMAASIALRPLTGHPQQRESSMGHPDCASPPSRTDAIRAASTAPPADRRNSRWSCDRSWPGSIRASPRNSRCPRRRARRILKP